VGGKMRGTVDVSVDVTQEEAVAAASAGPAGKWTEGKEIKKVIFVPGKILNLIVGK